MLLYQSTQTRKDNIKQTIFLSTITVFICAWQTFQRNRRIWLIVGKHDPLHDNIQFWTAEANPSSSSVIHIFKNQGSKKILTYRRETQHTRRVNTFVENNGSDSHFQKIYQNTSYLPCQFEGIVELSFNIESFAKRKLLTLTRQDMGFKKKPWQDGWSLRSIILAPFTLGSTVQS